MRRVCRDEDGYNQFHASSASVERLLIAIVMEDVYQYSSAIYVNDNHVFRFLQIDGGNIRREKAKKNARSN